MTEPSENREMPEAIVNRRRFRTSHLIWILPVIAMLIGLSLAIKSYLSKGPVITISFATGEGIEAGKTKIKYKDVQIGLVRSVAISKDRSHVTVTADIFKDAAGLLVEDTRFWVVRARITGGSISGLGTLMDGAYIGLDAGKSDKEKLAFVGLERPPAVTLDVPGRQFVLHADSIGSLDVGSPIFFHRMQVGQVLTTDLDKDGRGITVKVFVRAPYDQYVKNSTLFWHASGVDFSLDANGVKVNTESILSILMGGISFQTPDGRDEQPQEPAAADTQFTLFATHDEALKRQDKVIENYLLVFSESVRGLTVGAPVDLRGVTVGEVTKIHIELDGTKRKFSIPVEIRFYPERLRARMRSKSDRQKPVDCRKQLDALVAQGFRAQLRTGSLLTGQMYVALDMFPKASRARMNWSSNPPQIPTIAGSMEQFQNSLMHIVQKLERLPMDEMAGDARKGLKSLDATLQSADKLIKNLDAKVVPEARGALEDARKAIHGVQQTMATDSQLQVELRDTLKEVGRAAQSLRQLSDYLERNPEALIRGKKGEGR